MVSRIGGPINPAQAKGDAVGRAEQENRDKGSGRKKDEAPTDPKEDGTFFSIEAIRVLLQQENAAENEAMASLDLLQQHGINSIPIRSEQSIIAAITAAVAQLQGK